jgi:hypothetical protein
MIVQFPELSRPDDFDLTFDVMCKLFCDFISANQLEVCVVRLQVLTEVISATLEHVVKDDVFVNTRHFADD